MPYKRYYNPDADLDDSGSVGALDFSEVVSQFGQTTPYKLVNKDPSIIGYSSDQSTHKRGKHWWIPIKYDAYPGQTIIYVEYPEECYVGEEIIVGDNNG